jgi:hypothetical protein
VIGRSHTRRIELQNPLLYVEFRQDKKKRTQSSSGGGIAAGFGTSWLRCKASNFFDCVRLHIPTPII